jgi:S-DNA-T family DNA segregation ATPase FtsK/SpoIIIE
MLTLQGITQTTAEAAENEGVDMGDPLFKEACEVVVRHKQGSVSLLQRRLGIGYQRAARLIDKLEEAGIVSPFDGSKAREVIVDKNYLDTLFGPAANAGKAESTQN